MSSYVLYRAFDANEKLLYVGQSTSVMGRLKEHIKSSEWSGFVNNITFQRFANERQLFRAELKAIQEEKPMYNKTHNRKYKEQIIELRLKIKQIKDEQRKLKADMSWTEMQRDIACNAFNFISKLPMTDELRQGFEIWKLSGDYSWVYEKERAREREHA